MGKELVKRSHKLAEKSGCSHTYILATGMFSQKIFQSLDYKLIYEVRKSSNQFVAALDQVIFGKSCFGLTFSELSLQINYADHEKDKRGRPLLHDHGQHVSIQTVLFKHQDQDD